MAAALFTSPLYAIPLRAHARGRGRLRVLAALLIMALLSMQLLGLVHGIAHAGWPPSVVGVGELSRNAALFNYLDSVEDDNEEDEGERTFSTSAAASPSSESAQQAPSVSENGRGHHHHSCVEYDAAAGTTGIHINYRASPLLPGTHVLALWQAFISWDAPFLRHFSSRAPPC